jgi:hypothetical protein
MYFIFIIKRQQCLKGYHYIRYSFVLYHFLFGVGAVMGSLVASFKMETAAPMLYTMTACVVISALSYYFLTYRNER